MYSQICLNGHLGIARSLTFAVNMVKERTSQEDSLRSEWRNALSSTLLYRPSRIVTSFYKGKEASSHKREVTSSVTLYK
jgi:hypothetical protein